MFFGRCKAGVLSNLNKRGYVQIPAATCNRATPVPSYAWDEQRWGEKEIARKMFVRNIGSYTSNDVVPTAHS
jgi:hypothetical protein